MKEEEEKIELSINTKPSFTETWYEGHVTYNGVEHKFWLIHPDGVDENGNEYELDIRWFFARVPREIRALYPQIISAFKQKQYGNATTKSYN